MKAILLPVLLAGAAMLTGCETVAVVDHSPYYRPGVVYYDSGRPYYYASGVRYWGYPRGYYGGSRYGYGGSYTHVDVERNVTRNYYVDRRTVGRQDNRYHRRDVRYDRRADRYEYRRPQGAATNVNVQRQQGTTKKKKVHGDDRD